MFRLKPLARSVNLQAATVDQHVQWTLRELRRLDHCQSYRTPLTLV